MTSSLLFLKLDVPEKRSTLKQVVMLPREANYFLLEQTFSEGNKTKFYRVFYLENGPMPLNKI